MHGTLTRKFVDLMAEYQELQTKYKNKYRERVSPWGFRTHVTREGEQQLRIARSPLTRTESHVT